MDQPYERPTSDRKQIANMFIKYSLESGGHKNILKLLIFSYSSLFSDIIHFLRKIKICLFNYLFSEIFSL